MQIEIELKQERNVKQYIENVLRARLWLLQSELKYYPDPTSAIQKTLNQERVLLEEALLWLNTTLSLERVAENSPADTLAAVDAKTLAAIKALAGYNGQFFNTRQVEPLLEDLAVYSDKPTAAIPLAEIAELAERLHGFAPSIQPLVDKVKTWTKLMQDQFCEQST